MKKLIEGFLDRFYRERNSFARQILKTKTVSASQLVTKLDRDLLFFDQIQPDQIDQAMEYINDQGKYIEKYVTKYIDQIQLEIFLDFQYKMQKEMYFILTSIMHNVEILKTSFVDESIQVKDYFVNRDKTCDKYYERILYQIILKCLWGQQIANEQLEEIDNKYKNLFQGQFIKIAQPIQIIQNQSDEEIQSLKNFIEEIFTQLEILLTNISEQNMDITKLKIKSQLDEIMLKMNGCQYQCPLCKRKCDMDNQKHNEHYCQNGHFLMISESKIGMNEVFIRKTHSLDDTCEMIKDRTLIIHQEIGKVEMGADVFETYSEWNFRSPLKTSFQKYLIKLWKEKIGDNSCEWTMKEQGILPLKQSHIGNIQNKCRTYAKSILLILFVTEAEYEVISVIQQEAKYRLARITIFDLNSNSVLINQQPISDKLIQQLKKQKFAANGEQSLKLIFGEALKQINTLQQDYEQIVIICFINAYNFYPTSEIKQFTKLQFSVKAIITMIICSEQEKAISLEKIALSLKPHLQYVELRDSTCIKDIKNVWSDVLKLLNG